MTPQSPTESGPVISGPDAPEPRKPNTIIPVSIADDLTFADLRRALAAGMSDFFAYPVYGLFFAAFYAIGGAALVYGLAVAGEGWWMVPAIAGFPILAPFAAVGLYEVSRRREQSEPLSWRAVLGALAGRDNDQVMMMGGVIFIAFTFWLALAHGIFAIFLGESGIGVSSMDLLLSPQALLMYLVGGVIGGLFAFGLYAITVITLPMLIDRDVDFITAIITSLATIRANKRVMIGWALIIAVTLTIAMIPAFLGLFIALPVLGHATWHLYRRVVT